MYMTCVCFTHARTQSVQSGCTAGADTKLMPCHTGRQQISQWITPEPLAAQSKRPQTQDRVRDGAATYGSVITEERFTDDNRENVGKMPKREDVEVKGGEEQKKEESGH